MKIYKAWRLDAEKYQQDRSIVLVERDDEQEALARYLSREKLEVLREGLYGLPGDSIVIEPNNRLIYLAVTIKPRQRQSSPKAVAAARTNGALGGRPRKSLEVACTCEKCGNTTGIDARVKLCVACKKEENEIRAEREEAEKLALAKLDAEYNSAAGRAYRKRAKIK